MRRAVWAIGIFLLFGLTLATDHFLPPRTNHFNLANISTDSVTPHSDQPASFSYSTALEGISEISISARFNATDDNYDNIFQTADGPDAIRLEFTHPGRLNLALSDRRYYPLTEGVSLNHWHEFHLHGLKGRFLEVVIDGVPVFRTTDPELVGLRYKVGLIAVGSGYSRQRAFQGAISGFNLTITHVSRRWIADLLLAMAMLTLFTIYIQQLTKFSSAEASRLPTAYIWGEYAVIFVFVAAGFIGWHVAPLEPRLNKWHLLLFPLLAAVALLSTAHYRPNPSGRFSRLNPLVWGGIGVLLCFGLLGVQKITRENSLPFLGRVVPFVGSLAAIAVFHSGPHPRGKGHLSSTVLALAFAMVAWCALFELPNWKQVAYSIEDLPAIGFFLTLLCLVLTLRGLLPSGIGVPAFPPGGSRYLLRTVFQTSSLAYVCFFVLSFRCDTLYLGSSAMHWEYFVGPIRGVRQGAALLRDAPSQYGFLNIILAALVPAQSAWEALYLWQGTLLFFASCLAYRAICLVAPGKKLFAFFVVTSAVFFADPALIGPQLYPSSSVLRFFWVYVLIYLLARLHVRGEAWFGRYLWAASLAWLGGLLWSAESALYSSAILFASLTAMALMTRRQALWVPAQLGGQVRTLGRQMMIPVVLGLLAVGAISGYYRLKLGAFPDWQMYVEYIISYGAGFGALPMNPDGVGWLFILILIGFVCAVRNLALTRPDAQATMASLTGLLACIWATSSYFIGRSAPTNVTAILPIIATALVIGVQSAEAALPGSARLLQLVSVPVLTVALTSGLASTKWPGVMPGLATLTSRVGTRLHPFDPELGRLKEQAGVTPAAAVAYYGFATAMRREDLESPDLTYEHDWLPTPLQLLEEPIAPARREIILRRFMDKHLRPGFFIQAKNENADRAEEWIKLISRTHRAAATFESPNYRIIFFVPIRPAL